MSEEVDIRVTPSLHPVNVSQIEGYDDETRPYVGQVETAFSECYEGLRLIHNARAAAKNNPVWGEAQQVMEVQSFADKVYARAARHLDGAKGNLDRSIGALEAQLSSPVQSKAAHGISAEIRTYVKSLPTGERMAFLQGVIADGDDTTASAVLGGPAFLSGIDANTQSVLTRLYHERTSPAVAKRVRVMTAARTMLMERGVLLHREVEKAVGMSPHRVAALRAAKTDAEKAFVLRNAVD